MRWPTRGEGPGVRGRARKARADPSSGPSGHLLPQGEKGATSAFRPGRRGELLNEFRADFRRRGQPMRALKMAKSAPGFAVLGAIGLDCISELHERDLGGAHQMRSVVEGLAAQ